MRRWGRSAARRLGVAGALATALTGLAVALAGPAFAHATVVSSTPGDGTRLSAAPRTVTITFDENVGISDGVGYLHVTNGDGARVDAGAVFHPGGDGTKVADTLKPGLGDGNYTASFRVISADSHPVAGTIRFVVGSGALVHGSVAAGAGDGVTGALFDVVRWVSFAGLALLGGGWLVLTVWPEGRDDRRARRIVWSGWGAVTAGAILELLIQGAYGAGRSIAHLADPSLIDATLHTDYGQLHCARLVLLGLVALGLVRSLQADARRARGELAFGAAAVGIALTYSAGGHAATTSPAWLSTGVDAVHLLSMGTWIGGLVLIVGAVFPRRAPVELDAALPVFSRVAFVAVLLLVVSGTYSAWRGIGTWDAILGTTYGLIVLAKVLLLVGIVAVAQLSRRLVQARVAGRVVPDAPVEAAPVETERTEAVRTERLRRAVYVEAMVGLAVLALSAVLVNEPRGREALAATYREPISAGASLGGTQQLVVSSDSGTHGTVSLTVTLSGGARATSISATATQPAKEIGPIPVRLTREATDTFDGTATLPVAGTWRIDLVVTSSEFDAVTTSVSLHLH